MPRGSVALLLVLATSLLGLKARVVPRWVAWLGFLVSAVMLLTALFVGFFVLLAWVLLVSIVLLVRGERAEGLSGLRA